MFLIMAIVLFVAFVGNVFLASVGLAKSIGNVGELLLLISCAGSFVIAILRAEATRENSPVTGNNADREE
ncbi:MAG: hypothetical protein R3D32_13495 [Nitratireductor sp.]